MGDLQASIGRMATIAVTWFLLSVGSAAPPAAAQDAARIRVACLGDSITFGSASGVDAADLAHFSYPAVLGSILGSGFEVRGFGAGGHSLRSDAPLVFATSGMATRAMEFAPDIAVIVLGTNDTVLESEYVDFDKDFDGLVARLRSANPDVVVWLSSPPPMFPGREGLSPERRANLEARQPWLNRITLELQRIAGERKGVHFVDVRDALRPRDVTDGVHLNPFGAERLAYRFAETLLGEPVARTTTAVPSVEYRGSSAGWGGGTWRDAYASLKALAAQASQQAPVDVLFLGDSITQALTGHTERWSKPGGARVFDGFHGGRRAVSLGLSGDRTEHILYRIQDGSLDGFRPRQIVLQVGINNVNAAGDPGYRTTHGIMAVVRALESRFPEAHILISGPFPGGVEADSRVRTEVDAIHWLLGHATLGPRVDLLDLRHLFVGPDGALLETMAKDGIHITPLGQRRWMEALEPYLKEPLVTEAAGRYTVALSEDVSVEIDASRGIRSLTVGEQSVGAPDPQGKEWCLDTSPVAMRVTGILLRGGSVRMAMDFDLDSWEADAEQRAATTPNAEGMAETWRLASLGAARGYDRLLTRPSQNASLGDDFTVTTRRTRAPLAFRTAKGPEVVDFYGHSTVSDSGLTYDIHRIEADGGVRGWWFRSGVHPMNQVVNLGQDPRLREVVLLEPAGSEPIPLDDVIGAYVTIPQDRKSLLGR